MKKISFLVFFLLISFNGFSLSVKIAQTNNTLINKEPSVMDPSETAPARTVPSLEVVQEELTQAEKDFEIAKKMFNPWYGGPLITGSGATLSQGLVNVQPYLYYTVN